MSSDFKFFLTIASAFVCVFLLVAGIIGVSVSLTPDVPEGATNLKHRGGHFWTFEFEGHRYLIAHNTDLAITEIQPIKETQ